MSFKTKVQSNVNFQIRRFESWLNVKRSKLSEYCFEMVLKVAAMPANRF